MHPKYNFRVWNLVKSKLPHKLNEFFTEWFEQKYFTFCTNIHTQNTYQNWFFSTEFYLLFHIVWKVDFFLKHEISYFEKKKEKKEKKNCAEFTIQSLFTTFSLKGENVIVFAGIYAASSQVQLKWNEMNAKSWSVSCFNLPSCAISHSLE